MGRLDRRFPHYGAARVAGWYALFGTLWIVFSDRLVASMAANEAQITFLQTVKGGAFVALSAIILFGMVYREQRHWVSSNEELHAALQQVHILHRILRHNLRNITSIIGGKIHEIKADADSQASSYEVLERQIERLTNLSDKSRLLAEFLVEETDGVRPYELVEMVEMAVATARDEYPHARIHLEAPSSASVQAHHLIDRTIEELIENAIQHNPDSSPSVWLQLEQITEWVALTIEDDGPGIPTRERIVLGSEFETPMEHSLGLGLWLVQMTIQESSGEFTIDDSERGGSKTVVRLPAG